MRRYFVESEETCPVCDGCGMVQHPAWAAYWQEHHGQSLPTAEADARWFREWGYDEIPNEEIPCAECDGRGVLVSRVPLAEALDDRITSHIINLEAQISAQEERLNCLDQALRELAAIVGFDAWASICAIITGNSEEGGDE